MGVGAMVEPLLSPGLVIALRFLLSGDVELNPGPLDNETEKVLSTVNDITLREDDWNAVVIECYSLASQWKLISVYLGLPPSVIEAIMANSPGDVMGCFNEAMMVWIKQDYDVERFGLPSWRRLLRAVAMVDTLQFRKLASRHQVKPSFADVSKGATSSADESKGATSSADESKGATSSSNHPKPADPYKSLVSSRHLQLIKWTDRGRVHRFYLMERIAHKWRDIATLIGLPLSKMEFLAVDHQNSPVECCRAVLGHWLKYSPPDYPSTWIGLLELLEDCQLADVAAELKAALNNSNIF